VKKIILISALFFIIFSGAFLFLCQSKNIQSKNSKKKITANSGFNGLLTPTQIPTLPPPTATPTPTQEEIAAARKKAFEDLNQKYGPCRFVPVLMYHHVLNAQAAKAIGATNLNVPPEIFREQIDYLLAKGYHVIGLDEMVSQIRDNTLPPKSVVLTFDDGYNNFYANVYSILKEKHLKATVFVISQFVGGDRYLSWSEIKEMSDSGLVLIGDHTLNHLALPALSREDQKNQILSAKTIIEDHIQKSVRFFAYPYGSYNSVSEESLRDGGFLGAVVTTNRSPQCWGLPYELSRLRIGPTSLSLYGL